MAVMLMLLTAMTGLSYMRLVWLGKGHRGSDGATTARQGLRSSIIPLCPLLSISPN
jgi:hypothetical protein